jgi:DNA-binding response OmpR family regulator
MAKKKHILIVEDEPFLVEMYKARFEQEGYKVDVAFNGTTVVESITKTKPDIVLLDIVMPEKDGYAVLRELKTRRDLRFTPVLVFSNLAQEEEIDKGLKLGADKYFVKSEYTPSQLVSEVEKTIGEFHGKGKTKK